MSKSPSRRYFLFTHCSLCFFISFCVDMFHFPSILISMWFEIRNLSTCFEIWIHFWWELKIMVFVHFLFAKYNCCCNNISAFYLASIAEHGFVFSWNPVYFLNFEVFAWNIPLHVKVDSFVSRSLWLKLFSACQICVCLFVFSVSKL